MRDPIKHDAAARDQSVLPAAPDELDDDPPSMDRIATAFVHDARLFRSVLAGLALQQLHQVAELSRTAVKLARRALEVSTESLRKSEPVPGRVRKGSGRPLHLKKMFRSR